MRRLDDVTTTVDIDHSINVPANGFEMNRKEVKQYIEGMRDAQNNLDDLLRAAILEAEVDARTNPEVYVLIKITR